MPRGTVTANTVQRQNPSESAQRAWADLSVLAVAVTRVGSSSESPYQGDRLQLGIIYLCFLMF